MYKVVHKIPKNFDVKRYGNPVIVLECESGGQAVIVKDDHCLVLMIGSANRKFEKTTYWFKEALQAIQDLDMDKVIPYTC